MSNILVIGSSGQLGRALRRYSEVNTQDSYVFWSRADFDLAQDAKDLQVAFKQGLVKPSTEQKDQGLAFDGVIIAAAYTAVDAAETDYETAERVNAQTPGLIADICATEGVPLVHVSTDYVFAGTGTAAWQTDDGVAPVNAYGRSKQDGEQRIMTSGARAAILRTSWVFDGTGKNFLTTMLRLGADREQLSVVADQIGRPTYAGDLAVACHLALTRLLDDPKATSEIYHVSNSGPAISWADFARAIFEKTQDSRAHKVVVGDIPSEDFPTPAKRPKNSMLDLSAFERDHSHEIPNWEQGLAEALKERQESLQNI